MLGRHKAGSMQVGRACLGHFATFVLLISFGQLLAGSYLLAERQSLEQMLHTSWTGRNGAPQDIHALAQTPDGMLWIGSTAGLYTFDGENFTAFQPAAGEQSLTSTAIRSLFVSKKGELWIGGGFVGVVRLFKGHVTVFDDPNVRLFDVREASDGTIWGVRNYSELVKLGRDDKWHADQNPMPRPGYLSGLFIDSSDTQWVLEDGHLYRRPKGRASFESTTIAADDAARFAEDGDHSIWIGGSRLTAGPHARVATLLHLAASGLLLDSPRIVGPVTNILAPGDGTLWLASPTSGLLRLVSTSTHSRDHRDGDKAKATILEQDGALRDGADVLLRDADGDFWVGGMRGLDRFQHATILPIMKDAPPGNWSVCANPQGEVWVLSDKYPLSLLHNGTLERVRAADGNSKLRCSADGDVWFLNRSGIGRIHEHRFYQLPTLPIGRQYGTLYDFIAFVETSDHGLLASMGSASERGLWKFRDGVWTPFAPDLFKGFAHALYRDAAGHLYVGRTDGGIYVFDENSAGLLSKELTDLGVISAFSPTTYGLVVVAANGIAVQGSGGFRKLLFVRPELATTVTGLQESASGDLWLNGSRGIVRVAAEQVRRAVLDRTFAVEGVEVREGDYIGPASFNNATNSVAVDSGGRFWFSTINGVVTLQTDGRMSAERTPSISILSVIADNHLLKATDDAFAPHLQNLTIRYRGINLAHPDKVIYRYKLDGIDSQWQDVGHRTEAIYTRLKPGRYAFRVAASNDGKVWSAPIASTVFQVLPSFDQTIWFLALCVLVAMAILWTAFTLRLRSAAGIIREIAEERAEERVLIARDLHDTLLQGVHGLMLSFHVAAEGLSPQDNSKALLVRALESADRLMIEGRDRVSNLRAERFTPPGLLSAMQAIAADLSQGTQTVCDVRSFGVAWDLPLAVSGQVFYIAREAMTNAFRHAGASRIDVELRYRARRFDFLCRDNGRGFDCEQFLSAHARGHWGIRGVMERAKEIRGTVEWLPGDPDGTVFRLSVPGSFAAAVQSWFRDRWKIS